MSEQDIILSELNPDLFLDDVQDTQAEPAKSVFSSLDLWILAQMM